MIPDDGEMIDGAIHIIPTPSRVRIQEGFFSLSAGMRIVVDQASPDLEGVAAWLARKLSTVYGLGLSSEVTSEERGPPVGILFSSKDANAALGPEGYELDVGPDGIRVSASTSAGAFYATQTLRQLLPPEIEKRDRVAFSQQWVIPAVRIHDAPRFAWRGMLLDCCRHFMSTEFIKRYIDLLAYYKMNRFHWHLTEDQGWRIEINAYPELTRVGAWRTQAEGRRYGGYYTKLEIREVVEYASKRHVTIVPEIEMPGHALAALASYPELSCSGGPFEVAVDWGVFEDVFCAGNDATFVFLEQVLSEVMELFPGQYIHIGGDECPRDRWQSCPRCQMRIAAEGLRDESALQSYFIKRIAAFLEREGRKLIGWDEILEGGLAPCATVQSWRGTAGAVEAAKLGHDAILSPTSHSYFDFDLSRIDLRQVYSFDPIPEELKGRECEHILGGECNMWTERAAQDTVDQKVFPRLTAMAECLWSEADNKDFSDFHHRLQHHYQRLRELGVDYGAEFATTAV
jgi:hexosaminidase